VKNTNTKIRKLNDIFEIRCDADTSSFEKWFLLRSDVHWDNPKCDRKLEKKHLEQAIERDAHILDFGDLFCAMQGKGDRRGNKSDLRPEHKEGEYLDLLVKTATDYYEPYADRFLMISHGNHETGVLKYHETDITERLIARLNDRAGSNIMKGKYAGVVRFKFVLHGRTQKYDAYYIHGYGGGSPVTKGTIQSSRISNYASNADMVIKGHIHNQYSLTESKMKITDKGYVKLFNQNHIQLATYKDEFSPLQGWHIERGGGPKPLGGCWLRFFFESGGSENDHNPILKYDIIPTQ